VKLSESADLLAYIDEAQTIEICQQLVRTKSVNPPGNERQVAEIAAALLTDLGLAVEIINHGENRASVLARLEGRSDLPGILYSAHLDTVPVGDDTWQRDPFSGELAEGKLWGRGASDMKSGIAAMISAVAALVEAGTQLRGDLIVALSAGEEVDSLGARVIAERLQDEPLQLVVVSEPSLNGAYIAEKGALWLEFNTYGKTAHGAAPATGLNAINMMRRLLDALETLDIPFEPHPLLGGFTCSLNTISGGVKTNVVPDRCVSTIDMRTVPGQSHERIVQQVLGVLNELTDTIAGFKADLRITNDRVPVMTTPDEPAVARFLSSVERVTGTKPVPGGIHYYTDAAVYVPALNIPMVICGPGDPGLAHQPDEHVQVDKLIEASRIFTMAAATLLGE